MTCKYRAEHEYGADGHCNHCYKHRDVAAREDVNPSVVEHQLARAEVNAVQDVVDQGIAVMKRVLGLEAKSIGDLTKHLPEGTVWITTTPGTGSGTLTGWDPQQEYQRQMASAQAQATQNVWNAQNGAANSLQQGLANAASSGVNQAREQSFILALQAQQAISPNLQQRLNELAGQLYPYTKKGVDEVERVEREARERMAKQRACPHLHVTELSVGNGHIEDGMAECTDCGGLYFGEELALLRHEHRELVKAAATVRDPRVIGGPNCVHRDIRELDTHIDPELQCNECGRKFRNQAALMASRPRDW